jgi:hypothetical protein
MPFNESPNQNEYTKVSSYLYERYMIDLKIDEKGGGIPLLNEITNKYQLFFDKIK